MAKAQAASGREEIATIAVEMNLEELEILAKRPSILAPPKEADVKQIDLGTGPPKWRPSVPTSQKNRNSCSPTFSGTTKISLRRSRPTCQVSQESCLST
jgi:hypothetical protein